MRSGLPNWPAAGRGPGQGRRRGARRPRSCAARNGCARPRRGSRTRERDRGETRKDLAEQRYQAEVAKWKLSSVQVARWSRIGDAIKTGKSNPVRLARGLRGPPSPPSARSPPNAARPAQERRQAGPRGLLPGHDLARTVGGKSVKLKPFRVPTGPNTRPHLTVAVVAEPHAEALLRYEWRQTIGFTPRDFARVLPRRSRTCCWWSR